MNICLWIRKSNEKPRKNIKKGMTKMKTLEEIQKIREEKRKELDLRVNLKANTDA